MAALALHSGEGAGAEGDGADAGAVREGACKLTRLCPAEQRRGECGRQVGAGERGPPCLLQDHGEVEECAVPSPVPLGQMEGEQTLFRQPVPVDGAHAGRRRGARVEDLTDLLRRHGTCQPPPYGLRQLPLFSGDCDAHVRILAGRGHWNGARVEHVPI